MIKGLIKATTAGKPSLVFLGIVEENVRRLKAGKPILVRGAEIDIDYDICIAYETTHEKFTKEIEKHVTPDTVVRDYRTEKQKIDEAMAEQAAELGMGPTGDYPEGSQNAMHESDEGGLKIGVAVHPSGNVVINFGKSVAWVGLPPEQAIAFADTIRKGAEEALKIVKRQ